ncbi:BlaI/MecI/CopY family transcriptional regulator [Croceicoccus gelatinilyticus]|uniref:BlaI/MecI/CopY family transcriptional regulator n=1 Tax=Croceicoccus gelatinilyticus TaxID=2835536 RepID=UPI001BD0ACE6|nr:type IV toxin-antitoxin system AbiEi family antitoxin domain-containing protein [Croceicoccus gelatinilyticus]MBS7671629.1 BlaI/MecI/CopY family transcriptional regulator [Croceicoccus gelatinilyticus]
MEQLLEMIRQNGAITVRQILEKDRRANWATTQDRLYRLLDQGAVTRRRVGYAFYYSIPGRAA